MWSRGHTVSNIVAVLPLAVVQRRVERRVEALVERRQRLTGFEPGEQQLFGKHGDALGHLVGDDDHIFEKDEKVTASHDARERALDDGNAL